MDVTKTIQELLLSKDTDNIIIASEILKTYPLLINTTFFAKPSHYLNRGDGNKEYNDKIYNMYSPFYYKRDEQNKRGDGYDLSKIFHLKSSTVILTRLPSNINLSCQI